MDALEILSALPRLDLAALGGIVLAWWATGMVIEHPPARRPSVSAIMADYRRAWMRQFVSRDPRVFDSIVLNGLREGTSFFASACMIAIGGALALIGNTDRFASFAQDLSLVSQPAVYWEYKILLTVGFLANGLLNFIWSNRLFGYNAVAMAAVPNEVSDAAYAAAAKVAEINIHAVKNFNRGLRSVYFALAALAWLLGAVPLLAATLLTVLILLRREFASHSRAVLVRKP